MRVRQTRSLRGFGSAEGSFCAPGPYCPSVCVVPSMRSNSVEQSIIVWTSFCLMAFLPRFTASSSSLRCSLDSCFLLLSAWYSSRSRVSFAVASSCLPHPQYICGVPERLSAHWKAQIRPRPEAVSWKLTPLKTEYHFEFK